MFLTIMRKLHVRKSSGSQVMAKHDIIQLVRLIFKF